MVPLHLHHTQATSLTYRHFPNGELDDGGGALPPAAAGLLASRAEEEKDGSAIGDEGLRAAFAEVDTWARSLDAVSAAAAPGGLVALADQLATACKESQVCVEWDYKLCRCVWSGIINCVCVRERVSGSTTSTPF